MTPSFNAPALLSLIVPPCVMLLVSLALWLFVRSEMRESLPVRMFASVVVLVGILLDGIMLKMLFGSLDWLAIAYQFAGCLFLVSSAAVLFRIWFPATTAASTQRSTGLPPGTKIRVLPRKARVYKNPKGRKPNRGRTAFSNRSTFSMRKC